MATRWTSSPRAEPVKSAWSCGTATPEAEYLISLAVSAACSIRRFWLYAVWEPETARNAEILLHLFLAEVFAFLFLRRIGAGLGGALVGSIAFGFTPSLVHRAEIPFIFPSLVWFPLLLYFVEGVVSTGKRRWVFGLSLARATFPTSTSTFIRTFK